MGSNGYIMHITYLNYVDISPAEPKKSIFRVCKTVKITKIPKIFSKKSILKYWFGLCGDLNLGQHTLWDILGPMQGRFFKNMVAPVDGMALQVSASGQKS